MPGCYDWDKGVGSPTHCEKLPIPTTNPSEAPVMLSGQTQGTVIVSRLFPLLPRKEPASYPTSGTDPGRGHTQPGSPCSGCFCQASPGATSLLPTPAAAGSPSLSQWHHPYPVYQDKPHPAIFRRGMTPGATGSCPGSAGVGRVPASPLGAWRGAALG